MGDVFKTQSLLSIIVETGYPSLAGASLKQIHYTKPDGTTGQWPAVVSGTQLTYTVADGDISQAGQWRFQAYVEVGGLKAFGAIASQYFGQPL